MVPGLFIVARTRVRNATLATAAGGDVARVIPVFDCHDRREDEWYAVTCLRKSKKRVIFGNHTLFACEKTGDDAL